MKDFEEQLKEMRQKNEQLSTEYAQLSIEYVELKKEEQRDITINVIICRNCNRECPRITPSAVIEDK